MYGQQFVSPAAASRISGSERRWAALTVAAVRSARPQATIFAPTRKTAADADARHLAIYLHHVALGASISACARLFDRDRASIRHACARIEDSRDDPDFDIALAALESALRAQSELVSSFIHAITADGGNIG
jgi:hypothetical protein